MRHLTHPITTRPQGAAGLELHIEGGDGGEGGTQAAGGVAKPGSKAGGPGGELEAYSIPSALSQNWVEVEAKQRLVVLAGLLRAKLVGGKVGVRAHSAGAAAAAMCLASASSTSGHCSGCFAKGLASNQTI